MSVILVNDLLDELREDNHRLHKELSFERQLCEYNEEVLKNNEKTSDPMFAESTQSLLQVLATDAIDIIEPNVVSIDLNPTESVKQNTYPIVSDNGLEVQPPIGDYGTQCGDTAADKSSKAQEIIDLLDDSDTEDTAAQPVATNQVTDIETQNPILNDLLNNDTSNSMDTAITSQDTAPATDPGVYQCLECSKIFTTKQGLRIHNGMFHRKPVDQLQASGNQHLTVAQVGGHIIAGFVKNLTPIPAVHNSSQSNDTAPATDPGVHRCLECRKSFATKQGLRNHKRIVHPPPDDEEWSPSTARLAKPAAARKRVFITPITTAPNVSQSNGKPSISTYSVRPKKRPLIATNEPQVVNKKPTQEVIDLRDDSDTDIEDAQPVLSPAVSSNTIDDDNIGADAIACPVDTCGKRYPNKYYFKKHVMAAHPGVVVPMTPLVKPYRCPRVDCFKSFQSDQSLQQHIQTNHKSSSQTSTPIKSGTHSCPHDGCGKAFVFRHGLNQHIRTVHSVTAAPSELNPCPQVVCDKGFSSDQDLRQRTLTIRLSALPADPNTSLKRFPCSHDGCDKWFSSEQYMRTHVVSAHSTPLAPKPSQSLKPYPCRHDGCGKGYSSKQNLNLHIMNAHSIPQ
ncbi:unnamed protein product [Medioppia subpectinata]|uniref:C2H2-type domain-containing protein n=1 Tax=Medioppia subpectinata TaxID=1979941 RepID=A0A7R9Q924_9ACAR|nr:unnamed protein product [Medioppia subpectinata]CAG2115928.1 unnamed protein product [Medioppia subpectinata]